MYVNYVMAIVYIYVNDVMALKTQKCTRRDMFVLVQFCVEIYSKKP